MGYMCPRVALINGDIELSQLSVSNVLPTNTASIYPNPATTNLTITVEDAYDVSEIAILDLTGKVVVRGETLHTQSLDISALENGYYTVRISTDAGSISQKLMKL